MGLDGRALVSGAVQVGQQDVVHVGIVYAFTRDDGTAQFALFFKHLQPLVVYPPKR